MNPHFTYKKFRQEHIPWYTDSEWIAGFPVDYWYALGLSGGLVGFRFLMDGAHIIIDQFLTTSLIAGLIWIGLIFASPLYHKWYHFIRR